MANLSIRNVPAALLVKLRERAARHHRSMQGELMALLFAAVESSKAPDPETSHGRRSGTRRIDDIAAEHRTRRKKPHTRGPAAADVIRAERDSR